LAWLRNRAPARAIRGANLEEHTMLMIRRILCITLITVGALRPVLAAPAEALPASTVSVTVRSSCSSTVKIKYDSTIASISPNEVDSRSLDVGDRVAVLDDSERELDSVKIESSTRELTVGSDCRSISAR
jgi:hypothetical protein